MWYLMMMMPNNISQKCVMYKIFQIGGIQAQKILLNLLIDYWHRDVEAFMLSGKSLTIIIEYIYFIIGLYRRGEVSNLTTRGRRWSDYK
jgi:hypothetical protein